MLEQMGMTEAAAREDADFVLYNTCCVRENAERRALGNVGWLKELKKGQARAYRGRMRLYGCSRMAWRKS